MIERLSGKPAASIPEACDSWSETCAAYRFLRNAQIGGFLGRKHDGEPGVKTIWRGLDQVLAAADPLRALRDGLG